MCPHASLALSNLAPAAVTVLSIQPNRVVFLELLCWGWTSSSALRVVASMDMCWECVKGEGGRR